MILRMLKLLFMFGIEMTVIQLQEVGADTCSKVVVGVVPYLVKRSRADQADGVRGSDEYINDYYLPHGWYSASVDGVQYLMPDKNTKPIPFVCGTRQPIYLKENHPDTEAMAENEVISVAACELFPFDICLNQISLDIRKCGNEVQYYLTQTDNYAAYCFDPPAIQRVANLTQPPNVSLGRLTVSPKLVFKEVEEGGKVSFIPSIDFVCEVTGGDKRDHLKISYTTYWYINNELIFSYQHSSIANLSEDHLVSKGFSLGITLRCGVKMSTSESSLKTNLTTSKPFFAGIETSEMVITMNRTENYNITFKPTVPYGCYATNGDQLSTLGDCSHHVIMVTLRNNDSRCQLEDTNTNGQTILNYHKDVQAKCGFIIEGCYRKEEACTRTMNSVNMTVTTQSVSYDDPDFYRLRLVVDENRGVHKIWKGYTLEIEINIHEDIDVKNKVCYSHVDPHMKTPDGTTYENNRAEGKSILYWNKEYGIQVQENTTLCDYFGIAYCTCAVAVRAGGDIFLINLCNDLKFIGMTSCKDNALVIQKYSDLEYQVQTNIGTLIKIRIRPFEAGFGLIYDDLMNIDIVMAPKDYNSVFGLCGKFDSDPDNDFQDRIGNTMNIPDKYYPAKFIEEWRLRDSDEDFLSPSCSQNVNSWEEQNERLFCYCSCYNEKCETKITEAVCSPSQYINCSVEREDTTNLCRQFTHDCHVNHRKRRSAFVHDPVKEMERRAKLSNRRTSKRIKRDAIENTISAQNATTLCTERLRSSRYVQQHSNLLGGYNISAFIEECVLDIVVTQNLVWISSYETAAKDAVQIGFKLNPNYTATHQDVFQDFKQDYCSSNCSGNGICNEGLCRCKQGYFGPSCSNDITVPPKFDDVEGGGFCDTKYGSECKSFQFQTRDLSENFKCKIAHKKILRNGTVHHIGTKTVRGKFRNIFNGECYFEPMRRKRSDETSDVMHYLYEAALSNDGINFGDTTTLYIFDSTCLKFTTDADEIVRFELKNKTCLIETLCYEEGDANIDDECRKCKSAAYQFDWTNGCVVDKKKKKDEGDKKTIAIVSVSVLLGISIAVIVVRYIAKKTKGSKRFVIPPQSFTEIKNVVG